MTKRNLLICFDAFGTLFKPKRPVEEQYTAVAHKFGLGLNSDGTTQFDSADVRASFRRAFKDSAREFPNYGRAVGMGATAWWMQVIQNTFTPLLPPTQRSKPLPPNLALTLLHRFSSAEGYCEPSPSLQILFRRLRTLSSFTNAEKQPPFDRVIVGVITNSDDRVPDILSAFGLRVSPLRFGSSENSPPLPLSLDEVSNARGEGGSSKGDNGTFAATHFDINFTCISYDVGFEKPDRRIFEAAEGMAVRVFEREERVDAKDWLKVYVGDEYRADVTGALGAGWNTVWIPDMDGGNSGSVVPRNAQLGDDKVLGEMLYLDGDRVRNMSVGDAFGCEGVVEEFGEGQERRDTSGRAIRCSSLEILVEWLTASK